MNRAYEKYYDLFIESDIGELGTRFFNAIGHLSTSRPVYQRTDAITLIKEDLGSTVFLDFEMRDQLRCVNEIAFLGKVNDDTFDYKSKDGFLTYFAVEIFATHHTVASRIKSIQKILMKCANRHTVTLFRYEDRFIIAYGYRNVGKKSHVVYSDWITDDLSAESIMDSISVWYLSCKSISHFGRDLRIAVQRDTRVRMPSYESIIYEIFPQYYEDFGFDEDNLPKKADNKYFAEWYRREFGDALDDFDNDSFFLTKDSMLEDDFEIDIDEVEMRMLEAELKGELDEVDPIDEFEEIDENEFELARSIIGGESDVLDPEDILKALEDFGPDDFAATKKTEKSKDSYRIEDKNLRIDGVILSKLVTEGDPEFPVVVRRTTWKRKNFFFVITHVKNGYAYGYMVNDGVVENNASYPIFRDDMLWELIDESHSSYDTIQTIKYERLEAERRERERLEAERRERERLEAERLEAERREHERLEAERLEAERRERERLEAERRERERLEAERRERERLEAERRERERLEAMRREREHLEAIRREQQRINALKKAEEERQRQQMEAKRVHYRKNNRCQHCGGEFKGFLGVFALKCKVCGRAKDY